MIRRAWLQALLVFIPTAVVSQSEPTPTSASPGGSTEPGRTTATQFGGSASRVTANATLSESMSAFRPVFTVPAEADIGATLLPNVQDPEAIDPQKVCPGYKASNLQASVSGFTADLTLAGDGCNVYGIDVEFLTLTVEYQTQERLHVSIVPTYVDSQNSSWFILSPELVAAPNVEQGSETVNDLTFSWTNEPSFGFNVTRKSTGAVLFSTIGQNLVFENQFIEFATSMPENYNLYGLGETIHGLRLGNNFTKTIYAADVGDPIDYNIYGSHPFYLDTRYYEIDDEGNQQLVTTNFSAEFNSTYRSYSHGVYLRNAHGQEILLRPDNVTWRTIGGSIDLYFFSGDSQPQVTSQYLDVIGLPAMQQYKTFGFHQCRWGYQNWSVLQEVVDSYAAAEIPVEFFWLDIDYMQSYRDFANDPNRFPYEEGQEFLSRLHENGQYWTPIVDSAIYAPNPENISDAYPTFTNGLESSSFLLNPDGSIYYGAVWPGYTVFPDWLANSTEEWWINELVTWHNKISFDSCWLDMSEVSSFCVGSCGTNNLTLNPVHPSFQLPGEPGNILYGYPEGFNLTNSTEAASASSEAASQSAASSSTLVSSATATTTSYLRTTPTANRNVNHPPYTLNHVQGDLAVHAVSPNATHHDGTLEYDVHNLFGHQIMIATYNALLRIFPGKRPFIIGRSTFPGSGSVAGHWGGDNESKWYYMYFSIPQALSFSLFGIPMFGVDTCGFNGNTDYELCSRWMQLSAFFPFYRNHNVLSAIPQEAYVWESVASATRSAMAVRFALLPYIYTLFHKAHTGGSTVMRALAWEFPYDPSLANTDTQFFLGPSILVTPVLEQGADTVNGVFPGLIEGTDLYYDWYNGSKIAVPNEKNTTISAPLGHIPVYVRGGSIIATQQMAMTTRDARKTPWTILVALGVNGEATGSLYLDDGESLEPNATTMVDFWVQGKSLYANVTGNFTEGNLLSNITVMGLGQEVFQLQGGNGSTTGPGNAEVKFNVNGQASNMTGTYEEGNQKLQITGFGSETLTSGVWDQGSWNLSWG